MCILLTWKMAENDQKIIARNTEMNLFIDEILKK